MTEVVQEVATAVTETGSLVPPRGAPTTVESVITEAGGSWRGVAVLVGLLAWLGIAAGWEYIVVVLSLVFMITMHELGHYLAARSGGMKVTEFFLGFGPRLWSIRRGETEYGVKGIWAGAYVKVIGMNNLEEVDPADESRTYRQQSYPKRMLVAVAGSGMHFIMAIIAIYAVLVTSGLQSDQSQWTVSDVPADGAAFVMGIEEGDRVLSGDGQAFESFDEMRDFIEPRAGQEATFEVLRDGEVLVVSGQVGVNSDTGLGRLGVGSQPGTLPRIQEGPISAIPETLDTFGILVKDATVSIVQVFSPSGLKNFFGSVRDTSEPVVSDTGPPTPAVDENEGRILSLVGATQLGARLTSQGMAGLLIFFFSINIFVGVINLAPLLPLDGGHVVIATYERLRSRKGQRYHADVAKALPIAYAVMILLISVGLTALWLDISDPISF